MTEALDLQKNKYSMNVLRENIYALHLLEILQTQTIDEEFAVNYILNKNYQLTNMEKNITINDVLFYQKHIKPEELMRLFIIGPTEDFCIFDSEYIG